MPSHDTFSRLVHQLGPERFGSAFARFTTSVSQAREGVVAIDGKSPSHQVPLVW